MRDSNPAVPAAPPGSRPPAPTAVATNGSPGERPGVGAKLLVEGDTVIGSLGHEDLDRVVARDARGELAAGTTGVRHYGEHGEARVDAAVSVFIESFAPPAQMLIFGAVDFTAA